jgi:hypothetical protein
MRRGGIRELRKEGVVGRVFCDLFSFLIKYVGSSALREASSLTCV